MGDPKKIRRKYQTPNHPWNKERIDAEKKYRKHYGLTTKKEIWKAESLLKNFKDQIKSLPSMSEEQAARRTEKLVARLKKYGLVQENTPLGDVLGFDTEVILDRRLQTIVHKKGLSRSINQARQFIIHEHITVNGKTINAPGYLVTKDDESNISFHASSGLSHPMHPERVPVETQKRKKESKRSDSEQEKPELVELEEVADE